MESLSKQLETLKSRAEAVFQLFNEEELAETLKELQEQMSQSNFWSNAEKAKVVSQKASELHKELERLETLRTDLKDGEGLLELANESPETEKDVEAHLAQVAGTIAELEKKTLFRNPHDELGAIVSIHAGAGGTDAMDWAEILLRMLLRYAELKEWSVEMIDESRGEEAGVKRVTFAVRGRYAYGHLKCEAGVHRLVRISPFDAEKMRHTSFALVEVIPELAGVEEAAIEIPDKDLRIDTFASSGAGGQSVNTTNSAVRITHMPTGLVVSVQNERSQSQNKETAMRILKSRLYQKMLEEQKAELKELRGEHVKPEWGSQIRSYVLHPYKMVKDHRTETETQNVEAVLGGDLDSFIESYLRHLAAK